MLTNNANTKCCLGSVLRCRYFDLSWEIKSMSLNIKRNMKSPSSSVTKCSSKPPISRMSCLRKRQPQWWKKGKTINCFNWSKLLFFTFLYVVYQIISDSPLTSIEQMVEQAIIQKIITLINIICMFFLSFAFSERLKAIKLI